MRACSDVKHFSKGLQYGDQSTTPRDLDHLQIISTCKHFFGETWSKGGWHSPTVRTGSPPTTPEGRAMHAGYDIESGRSGNNVNISARMLVEYYLPVFKTCVQIAKAKSIMCSYNAVNGVPSCANGKFMNGIVREQWGWDGFTVSDCG